MFQTMRLTFVLAALVTLPTLVGGCEPEETYKGKALSEWLRLAKDKDNNTRSQAMVALGNMKGGAARDVLRDAAKNDSSIDVRVVAFGASYFSDDETLAILDGLAAYDQELGFPDAVVKDPFIYACDRLGDKGAPLTPKLKAMLAKATSDTDRQLINREIAAIAPKPPAATRAAAK